MTVSQYITVNDLTSQTKYIKHNSLSVWCWKTFSVLYKIICCFMHFPCFIYLASKSREAEKRMDGCKSCEDVCEKFSSSSYCITCFYLSCVCLYKQSFSVVGLFSCLLLLYLLPATCQLLQWLLLFVLFYLSLFLPLPLYSDQDCWEKKWVTVGLIGGQLCH